MKNLRIIFLSLILFTGVMLVSSYAAMEKYGEEITNRKITEVKDIFADPSVFEGRSVTIEGKIASECSTGCWFYVKVGSGNLTIYVDTGKSGFAIPQKTGRKILVEGNVVVKKTGPMIQAKGVEIK
ncbi:MAG: DUF4920 domain-containing protein [Candidatus Omnitrophica bacterium]|nr:DUF4920 domain-containing protein [Candidatus Omnitrophota bacterium]MBU1923013.1 DUF4920 domain-containing protein [Candidatus Omnitrophota bacterium]